MCWFATKIFLKVAMYRCSIVAEGGECGECMPSASTSMSVVDSINPMTADGHLHVAYAYR